MIGVVLVLAGVGLCFERTARRAALFLGAQTLLAAVLLALPAAAAGPNWGGGWTMAGKAFALGGGALVVAATAGDRARWLVPVGRACLSGFFILGGIQHFIWTRFVMTLVPAWISGAQFWTYFAGVGLIAGGMGMQLPPTARLAAGLSAAMIFSWGHPAAHPAGARGPAQRERGHGGVRSARHVRRRLVARECAEGWLSCRPF